MSSGMFITISLPLRLTVTVFASDILRSISMSNFLKAFSLVPMRMSPSLNPMAFASVLNFIPIVMSFAGM